MTPHFSYNVEIAIVGSGPGGATTACTLAEAGRETLLLEEAELISENTPPFSRQEIIEKYRNQGITTFIGNPKIIYGEAKTLGGGSEINSAIYHRLPLEILEKWHQIFSVQNLEEKDLAPYYKQCEETLKVSTSPQYSSASLRFAEAAHSLNWKVQDVPRCIDPTVLENSRFAGKKMTMTETFIKRALKAGCQLVSGVRIIKLKRHQNHWILIGKKKNNIGIIKAKTVFLAGGAIQTPLLLRRSGIKKNIGNSLQAHPTLKVLAQFPEEVNSTSMGVPSDQVKEFAPTLSFGCSVSSLPYLQLHLNDNCGPTSASFAENWKHMAIYYAMIAGEAKGRIRPVPFFNDAYISYQLTQNDLTLLQNGLERLCTLLFRAGANRLYPSLRKAPILENENDIEKLFSAFTPEHLNLMTIHLSSSCPMGENLKFCATNSFGKLHGYSNLYISDASLLCSAPSVNPQGIIMAVCLRNANHFLNYS